MNWLQRIMIGRNGPDKLSNYTLATGFIFSIISTIFKIKSLNLIATALLLITLFRLFSKNVYARRKENMAFLSFLYKLKVPFYKLKRHHDQKRIYKFYKCPSCKQELRVPKGKGNIKITCPKCKTVFEKRT